MQYRNALFLSYDGLTDPLGQSQVIPYLVGLRKIGHRITVISFEKRKYQDRCVSIRKLLDLHDIAWHPSSYTAKPPVVSGLWDVDRMRRAAWRLHAQTPFDLVHARSYMPAIVALNMKHKLGNRLRFVFDMRGFWPDERVEGGSWKLSNPLFKMIYRYFKRKEANFFRESDAIVSLTNAGKRAIESMQISAQLPKIHVIPCCVDSDLFTPNTVSQERLFSLKTELGLNSAELVLGYLGSIGSWYLLDEMLLMFKKVKSEYPSAKFLFVSQDSPESIHKTAIRVGVSPSDLVIRGATRDELPTILSCVDVGICFIKACFSKQASSPTKLGEMLAMGIPVICNAGVGDVDELIRRSNAGVLLKGFSDEDLAFGVSKIQSLLELDSHAIRESAISELSLDLAIRRYAEVYNPVDRNAQ